MSAWFVLPRLAMVAGVCGLLAACAAGSGDLPKSVFSKLLPPGEAAVADLPAPTDASASVPATAGTRQVAASYEIAGRKYEAEAGPGYTQTGMASWYGGSFHGRQTANGETFDRNALTAAHPTLPLPSYVRVTNLDNHRSVIVRVNDRGPYSHDRLIDVSEQTAELLAFRRNGMTRVQVDYVAEAPLHADDKAMLLASYNGATGGESVRVASAPPLLSTTQPQARRTEIAFASDEGAPAEGPMQSLTSSYSAGDRILMAFDVAGEAPN